MRSLLAGLVVLCCGLEWSCGYVGEPLPPALNIASQVTDFRAVERGAEVVVDFTIPPLTTEQLVLKEPGMVDLRVGLASTPFDINRWADSAQRVNVTAAEVGPVHAAFPVSDWSGKNVVVGVRLINKNGRASGWSNMVSMSVVPPVAKPADLAAASAPEGARITWQSGEKTFRVFRRAANEKAPALVANVTAPVYVDATAQFGAGYEYSVQAVRDQAESVMSEPASVTPKDVFAPAPPAGLSAVPGLNSVELVWERNTESDLKGYRVYRAIENGTLETLTELVDAPAYSDRQVEAGKKYRYAVTAIDQSGNESAKTAPAEITAP